MQPKTEEPDATAIQGASKLPVLKQMPDATLCTTRLPKTRVPPTWSPDRLARMATAKEKTPKARLGVQERRRKKATQPPNASPLSSKPVGRKPPDTPETNAPALRCARNGAFRSRLQTRSSAGSPEKLALNELNLSLQGTRWRWFRPDARLERSGGQELPLCGWKRPPFLLACLAD